MDKPPLSSKELLALRESWRDCLRDTETFRKQRVETIRAFAGYRYGENGAPYKTPFNLLDMFIETYTNALVPDHPRLLVRSEVPTLKGDALNLQLAVTRWAELNRFSDTIAEAVGEALFSMGVIKIAESTEDQWNDDRQEMAAVFAECVQFDDYNEDIYARSEREVMFRSNEYALDYDDLKKSDYYENVDVLTPTDEQNKTETGDEKAGAITRRTLVVSDNYRRMCNLVDVWLPRERLVFTFARDGDWSKPLHWHEWQGPNSGPYKKLVFAKVPANLLPKQIASELFDLHDAFNRLLNKAVRSAEREKTIPVVYPGSDDDIRRMNVARDGEAVMAGNGQIQEAHFGGVSQTTMAFIISLEAMFNKRAGNLDALAGLGIQAPTAAQENLISQAASAQVRAMAKNVKKLVTETLTDVAAYLYNDPNIEIPLIYKMPGYERIQVRRTWTPEERRGDFLAYNFEMDEFSAQNRTPAEQFQVMLQFITQIFIPMMPIWKAQGIDFNVKAFIRMFERLMNVSGMEDLVSYAASTPTEESPRQIGESPRMPTNTTRTYERVSRPSGGNQDKLGAMMQTLLAGGADRVQPREAAKLAM